MYPRNAASPERLAIGQVVLIADGTIQTSAVVITVRGQGGAEATGGGTTAYGAEGTVYYTPTQAETNYTSFVVIASKASCFSASLTVVTTASATSGQVRLEGVTHTGAVIPTVSTLTTNNDKTGYSLTQTFPANFAALGINASGHISRVTLNDTTTTNTDMRGTDSAATATALATAQADLDIITGADGAALASTQQSITFQPIVVTAADGINNITLSGSGSADGLAFTRSGSGGLFDTSWAAAVESEVADALTAYDPPTLDEIIAVAQLLVRSDAAIATDRAAILTLINANEGTGAGAFDNTTDSTQALEAVVAVLPVATDIVSGGPITTSAGAVSNVDLVDVCTSNTDMRGTDGANTTAPDNASIALILADTADMQPRITTMEADINNLDIGLIYGTAATGTLTTTAATTNLTGYGDNQLVGAVIIVTSGAAAGERRAITAYTEVGGLIEFAAMTQPMANNDTFKIV